MAFFGNLFGKRERQQLQAAAEEVSQETSAFIGRIVRATTPLRLTGFVDVDGARVEALSTKGFVQPDTLVRIVGKRMNQWLVEPAIESERLRPLDL